MSGVVLMPTGRGRRPPSVAAEPLADVDPVALVQVAIPLAHLDRPFEYSVPAGLAAAAQPGVRVKVRFSGRDVDGFILQRRPSAEHSGPLRPLRRVISPEPVYYGSLPTLVRAVAARYAGTASDVLRLAVPARHARAEQTVPTVPTRPAGAPGSPHPGRPPTAPQAPDHPEGYGRHAEPETHDGTDLGPWRRYPAGASFLRRLRDGQSPWAAWSALPNRSPDDDWPVAFAVAAKATVASGRGVLLIVPDARDVQRLEQAVVQVLGPGQHVRLTADQGPQARYAAWLRIRRDLVRCVVGTRSAAFAPVADLGLVAWWDDGDDSYAEPRAPYPHVREVLRLHAQISGSGLLVGGFARSVAIQRWVEAGALPELVPVVEDRRRGCARVVVAGEGLDPQRDGPAAAAHLPPVAWRVAREALERGPVLVQVPRAGYLPGLRCQACRAPARCPECHGPLALPAADGPAECRWCGHRVGVFACSHCGSHRLRAARVGARRTAEELGRAFPGVPVQSSGSGVVLTEVGAEPAFVVATPGAEPVARHGYPATLLLDAWASLERPALGAAEESLRRWLAAAALTCPRAEGGVVVLCGVPDHAALPAVEALVRYAPEWFAARELAERTELGLPPAVWTAQLVGPARVLRAAVKELDLPPEVHRHGPFSLPATGPVAPSRPGTRERPAERLPGRLTDRSVDRPETSPADDEGRFGFRPHEPDTDSARMLLSAPLAQAATLTRSLAAFRAVRSARREQEPLTIRMGADDAFD